MSVGILFLLGSGVARLFDTRARPPKFDILTRERYALPLHPRGSWSLSHPLSSHLPCRKKERRRQATSFRVHLSRHVLWSWRVQASSSLDPPACTCMPAHHPFHSGGLIETAGVGIQYLSIWFFTEIIINRNLVCRCFFLQCIFPTYQWNTHFSLIWPQTWKTADHDLCWEQDFKWVWKWLHQLQ